VTLPTATAIAIYDTPGIYHFKYAASIAGCVDTVRVIDSIGIVVKFRYSLKCATGGYDSVFLRDHSSYLPWWSIDSIQWTVDGSYAGTAVNLPLVLTAAGTHTVVETVFGMKPSGTYSCTTTRVISLPGSPTASFTLATSPICESVPISFTDASGASIYGYHWDFGDLSSIILANPQRTYTWGGPANPELHGVTLTVRDSIGCTDDTTRTVSIYPNQLNGWLGDDETVCPDLAPVTLSWIVLPPSPTPVSYDWSTGVTETTGSISVTESGAYWVTVHDIHQCQRTLAEAKNVKILDVPQAVIYGVKHYCVGDDVQLFGYAGEGVSYKWYRDTVLVSTARALSDPGLPVGTYAYKLVLAITDTATMITCTDTSTIDSVRIYDLPAPPTIGVTTLVNCNPYHVQLTATSPVSGIFNWSDGTYGPVIDIPDGGPYRVWFTDLRGCISDTERYVPFGPEHYFPYFPTGCYALCESRLPLKLYGPPCVIFDSWAWLKDGTADLSGTSGVMLPYDLPGTGTYQWKLETTCEQTSGEMSVREVECTACQDSILTAVFTCDSDTPTSYTAVITFNNPVGGTSYVLGTDIGPLSPFTGTLAAAGTYTATVSFTSLIIPFPDSVTVELILTYPSGAKCHLKVRVPLPPCVGQAERHGVVTPSLVYSNTTKGATKTGIGNAMMVFPNPASGEVTISYEYGNDGATGRVLSVYDLMGRKMAQILPGDRHGSWNVDVADWAPGMYLIRMEGDGKALQVQRVVITH
jgi:PKD repeat protein